MFFELFAILMLTDIYWELGVPPDKQRRVNALIRNAIIAFVASQLYRVFLERYLYGS
jgi:hypothetical protein